MVTVETRGTFKSFRSFKSVAEAKAAVVDLTARPDVALIIYKANGHTEYFELT